MQSSKNLDDQDSLFGKKRKNVTAGNPFAKLASKPNPFKKEGSSLFSKKEESPDQQEQSTSLFKKSSENRSPFEKKSEPFTNAWQSNDSKQGKEVSNALVFGKKKGGLFSKEPETQKPALQEHSQASLKESDVISPHFQEEEKQRFQGQSMSAENPRAFNTPRKSLAQFVNTSELSTDETISLRCVQLSNLSSFITPANPIPPHTQLSVTANVGRHWGTERQPFKDRFHVPIKVLLLPSEKLVIELLAEGGNDSLALTPGGFDSYPMRRLGHIQIPTEMLACSYYEVPAMLNFPLQIPGQEKEAPRSPTSQGMELKVEIRYPPLDKLTPSVEKNEWVKSRTSEVKRPILGQIQNEILVTPIKNSDAFNAYFPLIENDPILLSDPSKGDESMTEQLTRQLRTYEMEFADPSLFSQNMSREFQKLMKIYDDNHETLQEFKNRFEGKEKTLGSNFEEIERDLESVKEEVFKLGERSESSIGELERIKEVLNQLETRIKDHDEKYEVDVSDAQEKVSQLEQDVIRIEVEKLQKQLQMTQLKSKAFIENSELVLKENERRIKTHYETRLLDLQQSKEIDIGEKQLLEMQKETINHAMNDYKTEMSQKLVMERERSKELIGKLQNLEQELEQKNKQIQGHISNNSQLLQKQSEQDRFSKNKFNEELEKRMKDKETELREKQKAHQLQQQQTQNLLSEVQQLREENQKRQVEIEQLKREEVKTTKVLTPTNKDRLTMKQLEERFHKLEKERDSLQHQVQKYKKELREIKQHSQTPQTPIDHRFHTTPIARPIASPPTSPMPLSDKLFDERHSEYSPKRYRERLPEFGGEKETPSARILRKFQEEIVNKHYDLSCEKEVEENFYQLGDKRIFAVMSHDGSILVRVGGGFVSMQEYLAKYTSKQKDATQVEMSLEDFLDIEENATPISKYTDGEEPLTGQTFGQEPETNPFEMSEIKPQEQDENQSFKKEKQSKKRKDFEEKMTNLSRGYPARPRTSKSRDGPSINQLNELKTKAGLVITSHKRKSSSVKKMVKATSSPNLLSKVKGRPSASLDQSH